MSRLTLSSITLIGAVTLAACVDEVPLAPRSATTRGPSFAVSAPAGPRVGAGRHIVTFSGGVPASFASQVTALGGQVLWSAPDAGLAAVRGLSAAAAATLGGSAGVQSVDADVLLSMPQPRLGPTDAAQLGGVTSNTNPAAAARFGLQWNMLAVRADAAWAKGFLGSPNVTIYMLDSGVDYLHADLSGRVDLTRSIDMLGSYYHFLDNGDSVLVTEADTVTKYFPTRLPITDLYFHGTHTAATASSNAVRAAGITSMTTLVAVKVCSYFDECPFSSILGGVIYGAQHKASVMNLSLGGAFPKKGNRALIKLINAVFEYATQRGVTIVVSAGNDATDLDHDPANYHSFCDTPGVICVAATGPTAQDSPFGPWTDVDAPAYYTNFGRRAIDVAAPGGNTDVTFVYAACSQTSLYLAQFGIFCSNISLIGAEGTSMSAPHVSGTAALLVSKLGRHPDAIKERIEETADRIGGPELRPFYGHGRVNVFEAVTKHDYAHDWSPGH